MNTPAQGARDLMIKSRNSPAPQPTDAFVTHGLPASPEAEKAVLGACLLAPDAFDLIADKISGEDFYYEPNRKTWQAIVALRSAVPAIPVDTTTLVDVLIRRGDWAAVGGDGHGISFLGSLTDGLPRSVNVEHYARIVRETAQRCMLAVTMASIMNDAIDPAGSTTSDLLNRAGEAVDMIGRSRDSAALVSLADIWVREWNSMDVFVHPPCERVGIPTGFTRFDELTSGGLHRGQLIVIGARPSVGKTSLLTDIARHIGRFRRVAIFNQEMTAGELFQRLVCQEGSINLNRLRAGLLSREEMGRVADTIPIVNGLNIHLDESASISMSDIRTRCRRLRRETWEDLGMIGIDYLQRVVPPQAENRNNEVGKMSWEAKTLAREMSCPVVLLSQLSRESAKREDGRPELKDLRDSGAIEADADVVALLHRDDHFLRMRGREVPNELRNMADLIVAKNRQGPCGDIKLGFRDAFTSFGDVG